MKKEYLNLIKNIRNGSALEINNHPYVVKTKTHYANINNPKLTYTKFNLAGGVF